jgi:hypothetical protein
MGMAAFGVAFALTPNHLLLVMGENWHFSSYEQHGASWLSTHFPTVRHMYCGQFNPKTGHVTFLFTYADTPQNVLEAFDTCQDLIVLAWRQPLGDLPKDTVS